MNERCFFMVLLVISTFNIYTCEPQKPPKKTVRFTLPDNHCENKETRRGSNSYADGRSNITTHKQRKTSFNYVPVLPKRSTLHAAIRTYDPQTVESMCKEYLKKRKSFNERNKKNLTPMALAQQIVKKEGYDLPLKQKINDGAPDVIICLFVLQHYVLLAKLKNKKFWNSLYKKFERKEKAPTDIADPATKDSWVHMLCKMGFEHKLKKVLNFIVEVEHLEQKNIYSKTCFQIAQDKHPTLVKCLQEKKKKLQKKQARKN